MKKRAVILCVVILVGLVGVALRIWFVNKDNEPLVSETYPMGEIVALEDDFFYNGDDAREGYEIRVNSAKVKTLEEFLAENGKPSDFLADSSNYTPISHVYDVEVTIWNHNTEEDEKNIDLVNIQLMTINNFFQVDMELLNLLYPQIDPTSFGFRVMPGTETTVHLPFVTFKDDHLSTEQIEQKPTYLLLSMYPVKKMVTVVPE